LHRAVQAETRGGSSHARTSWLALRNVNALVRLRHWGFSQSGGCGDVTAKQESTATVVRERDHAPQQIARPTAASSWLMYVVVVGVQAVFLVPIALTRVLDGDEGFYALSAKLVADGRVPYRDFWFLQAPLLPYVYGVWNKVLGESWYSLRLLSAFLTIAIGVLLYRHVAKRVSSRIMGLVAVLLFASSSLMFVWYSTIKTYALSTLLLFAAYVLVAEADRADQDEVPSGWRWLLAGALTGLAIDVRLLFAPVALVFAFYALRPGGGIRKRAAGVASLSGGLVLGLLPSIYLFALDPGRFYFDTLGYQRTRSHRQFLDSALPQKLRTVGAVFSGKPQLAATIIASLALVALCVIRRRRPPLAIAIAAVLGVVSLLPTPTYPQYFSTLVPFLVVGTLELVHVVRSSGTIGYDQRRRMLQAVALAAVLCYLAVGLYALEQSVDAPQRSRQISGIRTAQAVADAIDKHARPGEEVLSFWPGYLYGTHAKPVPGFENDFGALAVESGRLSSNRAARYKLLSFDGMQQAIRSRRARLVVLATPPASLPPSAINGSGAVTRLRPWRSLLVRSGYRPLTQVRFVTIFVR
jgi:hypothetical protein